MPSPSPAPGPQLRSAIADPRIAGSVGVWSRKAAERLRVIAMLAAVALASGLFFRGFNDIAGQAVFTLLMAALLGAALWCDAPSERAWRATLPVGGQDGTLARRFGGTALAGKLFAKTGTLNASNALSGYLVTASGRTFAFSALANDMPQDASATRAVDRALLAIAAAH